MRTHVKTELSKKGRLSRRQFIAGLGASSAAWTLPGAPALHARTPSERALSSLIGQLRGPVLVPGDAMFTELSLPRNLRFASTIPQAVALCRDADDAATALKWARETGTPFAIRGGGHNFALASSSPGLIISTRLMKTASLHGNLLQTQAGVLNRDTWRLLSKNGTGEFTITTGNCPNVGVTGATLGGGIGPNAPWAGLTADHLTGVTMVTAAGEIVMASADTNPDLFWALRGGAGGNFGIVTDLTFALSAVPMTRATAIEIQWAGADTVTRTVEAWQQLRAAEPRRVSATCWVYPNGGKTGARVRGQILANEAGTRDLLAPLLAREPVSVMIEERPWWDVTAWNVTPVSPSYPFWTRSLYADDLLPGDLIERIAGISARFPSPSPERNGFVAMFGWIGGAITDKRPEDTAYVHRNARHLVEISVGWRGGAKPGAPVEPVPTDLRAWSDEMWEAVIPHSTRQSYQNFPDPELAGNQQAYYGPNLGRLQMVKRAWDPDNTFNYPQSIRLA